MFIPLSKKGRFAPRPTLPRHAERVATIVSGWPGVHARTHWLRGSESVVDGADFYVGELELGHLHLDGEAHLAAAPDQRDAWIDGGWAQPFPWSTSFVVLPVQREVDVDVAVRLFRERWASLS